MGNKNVNDICDIKVGFNDTFKADNRILSIVPRVNKMIGWMVRNFISREANVFEIYKTLIRPHIDYNTQFLSPVLRHGNCSVISSLEGI